jgi:tripartite-type tricarboxylate transporter receptor subunit TctC
MSQFTRSVGLAMLALCVGAWAAAANAQIAAEFYRGKQIKVIVSFDIATDYDQWARLIVRHLGRHLPGEPSFVVQNMPAAGGIAATNHLFNVAAQDGTVIGVIGRNLPYYALVQEAAVRYDPVRFNWIGSPELTNRVCAAIDRATVRRAEDLFERELLVGGAGAASAVSTTPQLLSKLLGMKFRVIEGYVSPSAVLMAAERGEVEGLCQTVTALRAGRPGWIESGKLRILFNMERSPLPNNSAPSIFQFAKTEEQRRIVALYSSSIELGRPIIMPPNVPAERVGALRRAFLDTMADPAFRADAGTQKLEINVVQGQELASLVADLMRTPPEIIRRMKELQKP